MKPTIHTTTLATLCMKLESSSTHPGQRRVVTGSPSARWCTCIWVCRVPIGVVVCPCGAVHLRKRIAHEVNRGGRREGRRNSGRGRKHFPETPDFNSLRNLSQLGCLILPCSKKRGISFIMPRTLTYAAVDSSRKQVVRQSVKIRRLIIQLQRGSE